MLSQESEKEQESRTPAEASTMPAAPGAVDAGLGKVLEGAAESDTPGLELCAVSADVPDSVETVVVNTSNGTAQPANVVSTVLESGSDAGTALASSDNALGLRDAAAAAALSSVVNSEPAAMETVVSTEALPDVTVPSTSGVSSSVSNRCDARIVHFNDRDLESLRKIQDELNTRKSGGVSRSPGSPIVIRAELASPQKGVSAQVPQVLVVQKPSPGCSTKKADIRVIHPPRCYCAQTTADECASILRCQYCYDYGLDKGDPAARPAFPLVQRPFVQPQGSNWCVWLHQAPPQHLRACMWYPQ
ncbi:hypothetical protein MRX96_034808 [Rhipicephalus microplus]